MNDSQALRQTFKEHLRYALSLPDTLYLKLSDSVSEVSLVKGKQLLRSYLKPGHERELAGSLNGDQLVIRGDKIFDEDTVAFVRNSFIEDFERIEVYLTIEFVKYQNQTRRMALIRFLNLVIITKTGEIVSDAVLGDHRILEYVTVVPRFKLIDSLEE